MNQDLPTPRTRILLPLPPPHTCLWHRQAQSFLCLWIQKSQTRLDNPWQFFSCCSQRKDHCSLSINEGRSQCSALEVQHCITVIKQVEALAHLFYRESWKLLNQSFITFSMLCCCFCWNGEWGLTLHPHPPCPSPQSREQQSRAAG